MRLDGVFDPEGDEIRVKSAKIEGEGKDWIELKGDVESDSLELWMKPPYGSDGVTAKFTLVLVDNNSEDP